MFEYLYNLLCQTLLFSVWLSLKAQRITLLRVIRFPAQKKIVPQLIVEIQYAKLDASC